MTSTMSRSLNSGGQGGLRVLNAASDLTMQRTVVEAFVKMVVCRTVTVQQVSTHSGRVLNSHTTQEEESPVILRVHRHEVGDVSTSASLRCGPPDPSGDGGGSNLTPSHPPAPSPQGGGRASTAASLQQHQHSPTTLPTSSSSPPLAKSAPSSQHASSRDRKTTDHGHIKSKPSSSAAIQKSRKLRRKGMKSCSDDRTLSVLRRDAPVAKTSDAESGHLGSQVLGQVLSGPQTRKASSEDQAVLTQAMEVSEAGTDVARSQGASGNPEDAGKSDPSPSFTGGLQDSVHAASFAEGPVGKLSESAVSGSVSQPNERRKDSLGRDQDSLSSASDGISGSVEMDSESAQVQGRSESHRALTPDQSESQASEIVTGEAGTRGAECVGEEEQSDQEDTMEINLEEKSQSCDEGAMYCDEDYQSEDTQPSAFSENAEDFSDTEADAKEEESFSTEGGAKHISLHHARSVSEDSTSRDTAGIAAGQTTHKDADVEQTSNSTKGSLPATATATDECDLEMTVVNFSNSEDDPTLDDPAVDILTAEEGGGGAEADEGGHCLSQAGNVEAADDGGEGGSLEQDSQATDRPLDPFAHLFETSFPPLDRTHDNVPCPPARDRQPQAGRKTSEPVEVKDELDDDCMITAAFISPAKKKVPERRPPSHGAWRPEGDQMAGSGRWGHSPVMQQFQPQRQGNGSASMYRVSQSLQMPTSYGDHGNQASCTATYTPNFLSTPETQPSETMSSADAPSVAEAGYPQQIFQCSVCRKVFIYEHKFQAHEIACKGQRPYKCRICNKGFHQQAHLATHMKFHMGIKRYRCDLCHKAYVMKGDLIRHLKTRVHRQAMQAQSQEMIQSQE